MTTNHSPTIFYQETQRFDQTWVKVVVWLVCLACVYAIIQQIFLDKPVGNNPAPDVILIIICLVIGFGLPLLFYKLKLITQVRSDGLYIRFFPFHATFHKISLDNLKDRHIRTHNALLEYGGWGIRYSRKGKAYNVSGNQGLQLIYTNGKKILIGTQRPDEFKVAVDRVLKTNKN